MSGDDAVVRVVGPRDDRDVGLWLAEVIGRAAWGYRQARMERTGGRSGFLVLVGPSVWEALMRVIPRQQYACALPAPYLAAWRAERGVLSVFDRPVLVVEGDDDGWQLVEGTGYGGRVPADPAGT